MLNHFPPKCHQFDSQSQIPNDFMNILTVFILFYTWKVDVSWPIKGGDDRSFGNMWRTRPTVFAGFQHFLPSLAGVLTMFTSSRGFSARLCLGKHHRSSKEERGRCVERICGLLTWNIQILLQTCFWTILFIHVSVFNKIMHSSGDTHSFGTLIVIHDVLNAGAVFIHKDWLIDMNLP